MNITDFHCHLDMKDFEKNRKDLVEEFFNSGASQMVSVADPYETGSLRIT
ncbi:MAG: hypothetical protein GY757_18220, partial [bacterium]|nr:hypothetical protein [bacterium]